MWSIISTRSKRVCIKEPIRIGQHLLLHKSMEEKPSVFLNLVFLVAATNQQGNGSLKHHHFAQFNSFPPVFSSAFFFIQQAQPRLRCCFKCIQDISTKHKVSCRWFIFLHDMFSAKSNYKYSLHIYETMVQGCIAELTVRLMELPIIEGLLRS